MINLVLHTPDRAAKLKEILESHGIVTILEKTDFQTGDSESPIYVKINVDDLSLALKIIESGNSSASSQDILKLAGMSRTLLIPVDFSPLSFKAVKVGFFLAKVFAVEPIILHAYIDPIFPKQNPYDIPDIPEPEELEEFADLRKIASSQLSSFKSQLKQMQQNGELPDIKFATTLLEGVAEEAILQYCKYNSPMMVVMATRGKDRKEEELVGSVTAEVIDNCRVPVLAVPDNYVEAGVSALKRVLMFCSLTRHDTLSVQSLMKTFDYPACEVFLVPVSDKQNASIMHKMEALRKYYADMYPTANFHVAKLKDPSFDEALTNLISDKKIQFIIVPNKKSNAFSRLFKPTIAHKCLFERDIPMLALPV